MYTRNPNKHQSPQLPLKHASSTDDSQSKITDEAADRRIRWQSQTAIPITGPPLLMTSIVVGRSMRLTIEGNPLSINGSLSSDRSHHPPDGATINRRVVGRLSFPDSTHSADKEANSLDGFSKVAETAKTKADTSIDERPQSIKQRRQWMMQNLSRLTCLGLTYKHLLNMNTDGKVFATDATGVTGADAEAAPGQDNHDDVECNIAMHLSNMASKPGRVPNPVSATTFKLSSQPSSLRLQPVTLSVHDRSEITDASITERSTHRLNDETLRRHNLRRRSRQPHQQSQGLLTGTSASVDKIVDELLSQLHQRPVDDSDEARSGQRQAGSNEGVEGVYQRRDIGMKTNNGVDRSGTSQTAADTSTTIDNRELLSLNRDEESTRHSSDNIEMSGVVGLQNRSTPNKTVSSIEGYSDPSVGAFPAFQRRLNEMAFLENRTKVCERRTAKGVAINSRHPIISSSGLPSSCVCKGIRLNAAI